MAREPGGGSWLNPVLATTYRGRATNEPAYIHLKGLGGPIEYCIFLFVTLPILRQGVVSMFGGLGLTRLNRRMGFTNCIEGVTV